MSGCSLAMTRNTETEKASAEVPADCSQVLQSLFSQLIIHLSDLTLIAVHLITSYSESLPPLTMPKPGR